MIRIKKSRIKYQPTDFRVCSPDSSDTRWGIPDHFKVIQACEAALDKIGINSICAILIIYLFILVYFFIYIFLFYLFPPPPQPSTPGLLYLSLVLSVPTKSDLHSGKIKCNSQHEQGVSISLRTLTCIILNSVCIYVCFPGVTTHCDCIFTAR